MSDLSADHVQHAASTRTVQSIHFITRFDFPQHDSRGVVGRWESSGELGLPVASYDTCVKSLALTTFTATKHTHYVDLERQLYIVQCATLYCLHLVISIMFFKDNWFDSVITFCKGCQVCIH